jgi:diacylglycerol kinase (ATP)
MRARVFVNPAARKGGAARRWPEIRSRLEARLGQVDAVFSEEPGHMTALARQAADDGVHRFIAVGGDGTVNETLNGMLDGDGRLLAPDSVLCPIPAGTANELSRALGHLDAPDLAFDAVLCRSTRQLDLTVNDVQGLDGRPTRRFGYLISSFGSAATISHRTSTSRVLKRLGGRFSYFAVTLIVTLTYRHRVVRMSFDDGREEIRTVYTGLCCNTENGGGGMRLAPGARPDDGRLDYVEFGAISRFDILRQKPSWLYQGRHVEHPQVRRVTARRLRFESDADTLVDVDGETVGRLPLDVGLVPGGFRVGV